MATVRRSSDEIDLASNSPLSLVPALANHSSALRPETRGTDSRIQGVIQLLFASKKMFDGLGAKASCKSDQNMFFQLSLFDRRGIISPGRKRAALGSNDPTYTFPLTTAATKERSGPRWSLLQHFAVGGIEM